MYVLYAAFLFWPSIFEGKIGNVFLYINQFVGAENKLCTHSIGFA